VTPLASFLILLCLFALAFFARWVMDNPRQEATLGLIYRFVQIYARVYHRLEIVGREHIPRDMDPGPLVVVCNHTAGLDPLLVQAACPFEIRWMMATDMAVPRYEWFWQWAGIISVDRTGKDAVGAREAVRHVKEHGVLGVFPEGALERPRRHILPFHAGAGLIIARTKAPVMPVIIEGTPNADVPWKSLWIPSRSKITIGPILNFERGDSAKAPGAAEVAQRLHDWFVEATGWPTAPTPPGPAARG
jgi:1-acyl-sn-glycerol-3-phosphate acyltransferase